MSLGVSRIREQQRSEAYQVQDWGSGVAELPLTTNTHPIRGQGELVPICAFAGETAVNQIARPTAKKAVALRVK